MASNNIKGIGKSIGVKVSPLLFAKISVSVSAILLVYSIGIVIGDTFCKYTCIVNKPVEKQLGSSGSDRVLVVEVELIGT